mgnify:CR=1 FL=1
MKKTSPLMKILPIAVLAAVLIYFAVQLYNYLSDPVTTTLVTEGQAEDTIPLNGWMVRDEEPLAAQNGTISRVRQEGEHVGVGQVLARVYANDGALQTVSQIETLQLQLQQLQFALTSYLDPDAALKLDTSITGDILTLRQSLTGGDRRGKRHRPAEGRCAETGPSLHLPGGDPDGDQVGGRADPVAGELAVRRRHRHRQVVGDVLRCVRRI